MDYHLLQHHTVEIYDLENQKSNILKVPARTLLKSQRFDLFAKLFYIRNIENAPEAAYRVYIEHIMAFNPDGKEPGRDDKNGINDFISSFDKLITDFRTHEFDDTISIIPVDKNGVILDGSHRVAALAYFDQQVTIAQFVNVVSKCKFDYKYFLDRGLAWDVCDRIAWEMAHWLDNLFVACLWPRLGGDKEKQIAIQELEHRHSISYVKVLNVNMKSLSLFVSEIYKKQSWTANQYAVRDKAMRICGGRGKKTWFVFFENDIPFDELLIEKEFLRNRFGCAKDSLHITANILETRQIAFLALTPKGMSTWLSKAHSSFLLVVKEKWHYFKKVTWINIKSRIWKFVHGC